MALHRLLAPRQVARIHVHDVVTGTDVLVHESDRVLFEAPNWSRSGEALFVNGDGALWTVGLDPVSPPSRIDHGSLPEINNDHVLDPDGEHVYLSAVDGHVHRAKLTGGSAERITTDVGVRHFLHGVSPDGTRLAYVRMPSLHEPGRLAVVAAASGSTSVEVETGSGHVDGPEWSPDGRWIYFNTERWADRPGHAQLARVSEVSGEVERLVTSDTVDWFPHISPDGRTAVYVEFPPGTEGHPPDRDVALVVVGVDDWVSVVERIRLFGGQGSMNVNSWAPDSRRFAYISYPVLPA